MIQLAIWNQCILQEHLSDVWPSVHPRTNTKNTMCLEEIALHAQSILTIIDLIINTIGRTYLTIQ